MKKTLVLLLIILSLKSFSQNKSDTSVCRFHIESGIILGCDNELDQIHMHDTYFFYGIAGYTFLKHFTAELGFNSYTSSFSYFSIYNGKSRGLDYSVTTNRIIPDIKYNIPVSGNTFYLKGGLSIGIDNKMNVNNNSNYIYQLNYDLNGVKGVSIGYEIGFGMDFKIVKELSLTAGSIYLHNNFKTQNIQGPGTTNNDYSKVDFSSFGFNVGLIYNIP